MELALLEKQARILAEKKEKKKAKANKKETDGSESTGNKSSSKRKLENGEESLSSKNKKQHLAASSYPSPPQTQTPVSSTHSLTAAVAAKVAEQMAMNASRQKTSNAIKSLYNTGKVHKENFMNR